MIECDKCRKTPQEVYCERCYASLEKESLQDMSRLKEKIEREVNNAIDELMLSFHPNEQGERIERCRRLIIEAIGAL